VLRGSSELFLDDSLGAAAVPAGRCEASSLLPQIRLRSPDERVARPNADRVAHARGAQSYMTLSRSVDSAR
jgi:hypothetical protein